MSDSAPSGPKPLVDRFNLKPYSWALVGIIAFGWWPAAAVYVAAVFADLNGCTIVATGPALCLAFGRDWGEVLYNIASLAEIFKVTLPTALMLFIVWLSVLIISAMAWRRRRIAPGTDKMQVRFGYYGLALAAIVGLTYLTLLGWLPSPVLIVVIFASLFWLSSFIFALLGKWRDARQSK